MPVVVVVVIVAVVLVVVVVAVGEFLDGLELYTAHVMSVKGRLPRTTSRGFARTHTHTLL